MLEASFSDLELVKKMLNISRFLGKNVKIEFNKEFLTFKTITETQDIYLIAKLDKNFFDDYTAEKHEITIDSQNLYYLWSIPQDYNKVYFKYNSVNSNIFNIQIINIQNSIIQDSNIYLIKEQEYLDLDENNFKINEYDAKITIGCDLILETIKVCTETDSALIISVGNDNSLLMNYTSNTDNDEFNRSKTTISPHQFVCDINNKFRIKINIKSLSGVFKNLISNNVDIFVKSELGLILFNFGDENNGIKIVRSIMLENN